MSSFQFATRTRTRALGFLKKFYPNADVSEGIKEVDAVLDLVEKDIFRIPDPDYHPDGTVFPGPNMNDENKQDAIDAMTLMHDKFMLDVDGGE